MSTAKHTPGPWHVETSYSESGVVTSLGIHSSNGAAPATFANAYLMAAAPEMLDVLIEVLSYHANTYAEWRDETEMHIYTRIKDVIAKAKGEAP